MAIATAPSPRTTAITVTPSNETRFQIKRDQRCLFVGRTGSGKTTLADRLIRGMGYRIAVLDPKGLWNFPGYQEVRGYNANPHLLRQVFRPRDRHFPWLQSTRFLDAIWSAGIPTVVYIDELSGLSTRTKWPDILQDFVTWGRQWQYGTWFSTQRPRNVPTFTLTEAEHYFVFDLKYRADRERLAGDVGDTILGRIRTPYAFFYSNNDLDQPVLVKQE